MDKDSLINAVHGAYEDRFKPLDWNKISIPVDSLSNGTISAAPIKYDYNLPGELLDLIVKHDLDYLMGSGSSPDDMELAIKKDMAMKLAQKMMDDGHIVFTKQMDQADNSMRYKAYTWVGTKDFIEQQRKAKSR
jgi:hypothetical protein